MFKKIMKDERGLSLIELLAVVVIMAVIAGIGAVGIANVIQKSKEDAAISNIQVMMDAAKMFDMNVKAADGLNDTYDATGTGKNMKDVVDAGYINTLTFLEGTVAADKGKDIGVGKKRFAALSDRKVIVMNIPGGSFIAGPETSKDALVSENTVAQIDRSMLFGTTAFPAVYVGP